jgi:hypothetical protein
MVVVMSAPGVKGRVSFPVGITAVFRNYLGTSRYLENCQPSVPNSLYVCHTSLLTLDDGAGKQLFVDSGVEV